MGISAIIPVLLPIVCGVLISVIKLDKTPRNLFTAVAVLINSAIIFAMIFAGGGNVQNLVSISQNITLGLRVDGFSCIFGGLLAFLWPIATIYAFEYMEKEHNQDRFFGFYTMTYGIAVGVAFSANLITMYLFYELLTLITLPIIMHEMDEEAISAGRKYIMYSVAGAAFALMGIVILMYAAGTTEFTLGGVLTGEMFAGNESLLLIGFVLTFLGFGVKAAVFPFHGWLPTAGCAPTPVTALLHAVAVVKAGVFAIIRVIYYSFGADNLRGTWAQYLVMLLACITIVFGSGMALKERHLKRRLAYSTVSNLSYIVFGATVMTTAGLSAAFSHMIFHGLMKICLFMVAGVFICKYHKYYMDDIKGYGKMMPVTFTCFIIAEIALIGTPGFCGFLSKFNLISAAVSSGFSFAYLGVAALIISAVLTAIYLWTVVVPACLPGKDFNYDSVKDIKDPGKCILVPLIVLAFCIIFFGVNGQPIMTFFESVATGLI